MNPIREATLNVVREAIATHMLAGGTTFDVIQALYPEMEGRSIDRHRNEPIDALELPLKLYYILQANKLNTVGDLYDHESLLRLPGIGRVFHQKINAALINLCGVPLKG